MVTYFHFLRIVVYFCYASRLSLRLEAARQRREPRRPFRPLRPLAFQSRLGFRSLELNVLVNHGAHGLKGRIALCGGLRHGDKVGLQFLEVVSQGIARGLHMLQLTFLV